MTDTPDTSPEAVERLADSYVIPGMPEDCRPVIVAATLRALSAERDDQKKARLEAVRSWVSAEARAEAAEAGRDALKAKLDALTAPPPM